MSAASEDKMVSSPTKPKATIGTSSPANRESIELPVSDSTNENAAADLAEFVRQAIAHMGQDDTAYLSVRDHLKDAVDSADSSALAKWLESFCLCISSIDRKCIDIVQLSLQIDWYAASDQLLDVLSEFVLSLVSAHSLFAEECMSQIVRNFVGQLQSQHDIDDDCDDALDEDKEEKVMVRACQLLYDVLRIVPSQANKLERELDKKLPHFRVQTSIIQNFSRALLTFAALDPSNLLEMVIPLVVRTILKVDIDTVDYGDDDDRDRLTSRTEDSDQMSSGDEAEETQFDFDEDAQSEHAHNLENPDNPEHEHDQNQEGVGEQSEGEEEEGMDVELESNADEVLPPSHKLDVLMRLMFDFMSAIVAADSNHAVVLFDTLWTSFEKYVLPTYKTRHVQYLLFVAVGLGGEHGLSEMFVKRLLEKVFSKSVPLLSRQTAVAYVSSFTARALFCSLSVTRMTLQMLTNWIHDYLREQNGPQYKLDAMAQHHIAFYANCQAAFYIVCFHLEDLLDSDGGATFVGNLRLDAIVKANLSPLLVCQPFVVNEFARLTKLHEIVFCAQYMKRRSVVNIPNFNSHAVTSREGAPPPHELENFFPFDPYLLKFSMPLVKTMYRDWSQKRSSDDPYESDRSNDPYESDNSDNDFIPPQQRESKQPEKNTPACDIILKASEVIRAQNGRNGRKRLRVHSGLNPRRITSPLELDVPGFGSPSFSPYSLEHKTRSTSGLEYLEAPRPFVVKTTR
eukprot:m.107505 g.107505  ORF g.107505 m.107505 type:complete len:739 (-) comp27803_c0_seq1:290-2506(-)